MCDWWLSTELRLTVSLLAASTSIIPLSRFWQSGGIKWGIWNTPSFTFSSRFLRLSSSNGRAPWHTQRWQGWKKTKKRLVQNMHCTQRKTCEWCRSDRDIFIKELRQWNQTRPANRDSLTISFVSCWADFIFFISAQPLTQQRLLLLSNDVNDTKMWQAPGPCNRWCNQKKASGHCH